MNTMKTKNNPPQTDCKQCGTCCKKGGPTFHAEDKFLIDKGAVPVKLLFTIREGELAHDNVKGGLTPVPTDLIKIKGKKNSWECILFDEKNNACTIYDYRPLECKALKCWDTREIESVYQNDRLTRKDLLSGIRGLWEMVEDHHSRCSYHKIGSLAKSMAGGKNKIAVNGIIDIIKYDMQVRSLIVEKGSIDPEMVDFLLGRSLPDTIKMFGIKITQAGGIYKLEP